LGGYSWQEVATKTQRRTGSGFEEVGGRKGTRKQRVELLGRLLNMRLFLLRKTSKRSGEAQKGEHKNRAHEEIGSKPSLS